MIDSIVVSFNNGQSLVRCCESLLRQTLVSRVHVVDNTPGGADADLVGPDGLNDARVTATVSGRNCGFGAAINSALREVVNDYVAIVNPDGVVEDGALDQLVRALERDALASLAGARLLGEDGREQRGSRRREPTPRRLIVNTLLRALRLRHWYGFGFELSDTPLPPAPVSVDAVSGACMVARTEALRALGGFDEQFFLHFEDLDLCRRLRNAGGRVIFVPGAVFHHRGGGSSASRPFFVIWHKHLSMTKYYWKHYRRISSGGLWLPVVVAVAGVRCLALMARRTAGG